MKKYLAIFFRQIKVTYTYKFNLLSQFFMPLIQIFIQIFIWKVIYQSNSMIKEYSLKDMLTYIIITNLIVTVFSISHSFRMSKLIKKGDLSFILIRPYNYLCESFSTFLGSKAVEFIILLVIMIGLTFAGVITIHNIGLLGTVLLILNLIMFFMFVSFIGSLSFYLVQMWTMKPLFNAAIGLLGGAFFPLDILSQHVFNILKFNPFGLMSFVNTKVLLGQLSSDEILFYIKLSFSWAIIFFILFRVCWKNGLKKYEAMGV